MAPSSRVRFIRASLLTHVVSKGLARPVEEPRGTSYSLGTASRWDARFERHHELARCCCAARCRRWSRRATWLFPGSNPLGVTCQSHCRCAAASSSSKAAGSLEWSSTADTTAFDAQPAEDSARGARGQGPGPAEQGRANGESLEPGEHACSLPGAANAPPLALRVRLTLAPNPSGLRVPLRWPRRLTRTRCLNASAPLAISHSLLLHGMNSRDDLKGCLSSSP